MKLLQTNKSKRIYFMNILITCLLFGCASSAEKTSVPDENGTYDSVEISYKETKADFDITNLHEISKDDLGVGNQVSYFYDLSFTAIDPANINLKTNTYNGSGMSQTSIQESLMSPVKLMADVKVNEHQFGGFMDMDNLEIMNSKENHEYDEILSHIIGLNSVLPISRKFSNIKDIASPVGIICIYFYPISYKISSNLDANHYFYILKGNNQFNNLCCDGIYEIRIS